MRKGIDCKGKEWKEISLSNRMINIFGRRFNKLVALFPVESEGKKQWLCECDCGNQTVVAYGYLNSGKTKSCGCLRRDFPKQRWEKYREENNAIGEKYARLTVVDYIGVVNGDATYRFRCDCGNELIMPINRVKSGNTNSCGCLQREKITEYWSNYREENNLIGQTYGRLTVLKFLRIENEEAVYLFHCACGNDVEYPINRVKSGNTNSCGCLWNEWNDSYKNDIIGQRFGKLIVKSYAGIDKHGSALFECKCDCGNTTILTRYSLVGNRTHSCGCIVSVGESNIKKLLTEANVKYKPQQTFSDLRSDTGKELQYDFGILNDDGKIKRLIEFDGLQHTQAYNYFGGEEKFEQIQKHDILKNQYALSHNIPLVRIPYSKRDTMSLDDLFGDKYLIKGGENYGYYEFNQDNNSTAQRHHRELVS